MAPPIRADPAPRIVLYWLEQSRSQRILWLFEELNLPYELKTFKRDKKTRLAPAELKEVHPLGKSPVITITPEGSNQPTTIAESGLIIEYLLDHYGQQTSLLPKRWKDGQEGKVAGETEEWMRYKYYLQYAEGSFMTMMILKLVTSQIQQSPVPFFIRPITNGVANKINDGFVSPNLKTHLAFLEGQLKSAPGRGGYLCGPSLTGADILMSFPLIASRGRVEFFTKEDYPLLHAYVDKLEAAPGYKKSVDKIIEIEGSFSASI